MIGYDAARAATPRRRPASPTRTTRRLPCPPSCNGRGAKGPGPWESARRCSRPNQDRRRRSEGPHSRRCSCTGKWIAIRSYRRRSSGRVDRRMCATALRAVVRTAAMGFDDRMCRAWATHDSTRTAHPSVWARRNDHPRSVHWTIPNRSGHSPSRAVPGWRESAEGGLDHCGDSFFFEDVVVKSSAGLPETKDFPCGVLYR